MKNSMPPKLQALMMGIAPKGIVTVKAKKIVSPAKTTKKKKKVVKKSNKMGC